MGQPTKIIYADKMFGTRLQNTPGNMEIWRYPEELAMPEVDAVKYIQSKSESYDLVFSAYRKKFYVNPSNLLDAAVQNDKSKLGRIICPPPSSALHLLSDGDVWEVINGQYTWKRWEQLPILLHNPKIVQLEKGVIILPPSFLNEAVIRLAHAFFKTILRKSRLLLLQTQEWPNRTIENMVHAKFKRAKRTKAVRAMPPCVKAALASTAPLGYQLRFQLAEVFSYTTIEILNRELEKRLIIDGKHRQNNVRACFHVAKKKKADSRPCVTRGNATGLLCVYGGGSEGVTSCAAKLGYTGNIETVTISEMWGLC